MNTTSYFFRVLFLAVVNLLLSSCECGFYHLAGGIAYLANPPRPIEWEKPEPEDPCLEQIARAVEIERAYEEAQSESFTFEDSFGIGGACMSFRRASGVPGCMMIRGPDPARRPVPVVALKEKCNWFEAVEQSWSDASMPALLRCSSQLLDAHAKILDAIAHPNPDPELQEQILLLPCFDEWWALKNDFSRGACYENSASGRLDFTESRAVCAEVMRP